MITNNNVYNHLALNFTPKDQSPVRLLNHHNQITSYPHLGCDILSV